MRYSGVWLLPLLAGMGLGADAARADETVVWEQERVGIPVQPAVLVRRYSAVTTRAEVVAEELDAEYESANPFQTVGWRRYYRPYGWYGGGLGYYGPAWYGGGFGYYGPRYVVGYRPRYLGYYGYGYRPYYGGYMGGYYGGGLGGYYGGNWGGYAPAYTTFYAPRAYYGGWGGGWGGCYYW